MTIHVDPQALQILEHREKMLQERLRQVMARQYDLIQDEGRIRCDLQKIENDKFRLLETRG